MAWILFTLLIIFLLVMDLLVFHRKAHEIQFKEALYLSAFWIFLALGFNVFIYFWKGPQQGMEFLAGYLIEKSLSVDNIFVFIMIFAYFGVEPEYQHKILFWGIIGALLLRAIFILTGIALIHRFEWIVYVFGVFLVYTGVKMGVSKETEVNPEKNPVIKLTRKFLRVSTEPHQGQLFQKSAGRWMATPLFVVLLVVETTDVVFAVDSIPAILAISTHPFIVYTSNVFAILGLRALYFALAGLVQLFHYLKFGLAVVLVFVGIKMIMAKTYKIPVGVALGVVAGILTISIVTSLLVKKKEQPEN